MIREVITHSDFKWIDVAHPTAAELEQIGQQYQLHLYSLQDCMDPAHLPKFENFDENLFLIARLYDPKAPPDADSVQLLTRKIAIFYSKQYMITVHRMESEFAKNLFDICCKDNPTKMTRNLMYFMIRLLTQAVKSYQVPLEKAEARLDEVESQILKVTTSADNFLQLHSTRRQLSMIKRLLIHIRDVVQNLSSYAEKPHKPLFQDLKESITNLTFLSDELHEDVTGLINIQISLSANRTNDVMRVLTLFSVFFMPLTFIVGIYGMNFERQPEFKWEHGYSFVWALMIIISLAIALWFRKKGWLGGK